MLDSSDHVVLLSRPAVNLLLLDAGEIGPAACVSLSGPRADHLIDVLRVEAGQHVQVGILDGNRGRATVIGVTGRTVQLQCVFDDARPARPAVDLLLALPRPKVMRRLWAQLAALGVGQVILTNAGRVERNYFDSHVLAPASYRPLLVEGLQQARDTRVPAVSIHRQLKVLVEDHLDALFEGRRLVADPAARGSVRDGVGGRDERVLLAVGPEGGWSPYEIALLQAHGFQSVAMGARTLRTDTACVALLALVHDALAAGLPAP